MSIPRPFFGHPPDWIMADEYYAELTITEAWTLHMIAGACKVECDEGVRGCFAGAKFIAKCRLKERGFRNVIKSLIGYRFIVKLEQGGGQGRANELGIPHELGGMDHLRAKEDGRFSKRKAETMHLMHGSTREKAAETMHQVHGSTMHVMPPNHARDATKPCTPCIPVSTSSSFKKSKTTITPSGQSLGKSFSNDVDAERERPVEGVELRDDADEDLIIAAIRTRWPDADPPGIVRLLRHPNVTPVIIRATLNEAKPNWGVGLFDAKVKAKADVIAVKSNRARMEASKAQQAAIDEADAGIDSMSNEQLAGVVTQFAEDVGFPKAERRLVAAFSIEDLRRTTYERSLVARFITQREIIADNMRQPIDQDHVDGDSEQRRRELVTQLRGLRLAGAGS